MSDSIHIARDGQILGEFEAGKISDLLETGYFMTSDVFYDVASESWMPLNRWKSNHGQSFRSASRAQSVSAEPSHSRSSSGARHGSHLAPVLAGWIGCLFALGAAAGLFAWGQSLGTQLKDANETIQALHTQVKSLQSSSQTLTQLSPPGKIRGIIAYRMGDDQVGIASGATVSLFSREVLQKAIQSLPAPNSQNFNALIESWKTTLPSPTAVTITDANGRFELPVAEPGDYVVVSIVRRGTDDDARISLWLSGFKASDHPSPVVLLDEGNALTAESTEFAIKDIPPFAASP